MKLKKMKLRQSQQAKMRKKQTESNSLSIEYQKSGKTEMSHVIEVVVMEIISSGLSLEKRRKTQSCDQIHH